MLRRRDATEILLITWFINFPVAIIPSEVPVQENGSLHTVWDSVLSAAQYHSSQVKSLITTDVFCIVRRATTQSKTGILSGYGVAEAPPGFQAGWSDCMHFFSLFLFIFVCWLKPRTFWEIKFTYVFLCLGSISLQLYWHHYVLSSICRPQVYGRRRRRTKWPISTI
jgi:hypothetical protein